MYTVLGSPDPHRLFRPRTKLRVLPKDRSRRGKAFLRDTRRGYLGLVRGKT